jgi:UDP-glucuronate decarboxylase
MTSFPEVIRDDLHGIVDRLGERVRGLSGKRVLVTGASGMLPAYMVDTLAYLNDSRRLDAPCRLMLLSRSADRARSRLAHLLARTDVELVLGDARNGLPAGLGADFIVHAAAPAAPKDYLTDPIGSLDANTLSLRNLLELARERGSASVLYVSTSEVYGTPDAEAIPTPETYVGRIDPLSRRAYYAEAKRAGETYCRAYHEQHGVPVKIARPFHVHGPGLRLDDGRVVAALIAMGVRGERLALESDGLATRTYGYVSDATVALLAILLSDANGEAFNVGTDSPETSVLELATEIARLFGQTEPVRTNTARVNPNAVGAPARACPDLGKIRGRLGVVPRVGLREGLSRTVAWFRARSE